MRTSWIPETHSLLLPRSCTGQILLSGSQRTPRWTPSAFQVDGTLRQSPLVQRRPRLAGNPADDQVKNRTNARYKHCQRGQLRRRGRQSFRRSATGTKPPVESQVTGWDRDDPSRPGRAGVPRRHGDWSRPGALSCPDSGRASLTPPRQVSPGGQSAMDRGPQLDSGDAGRPNPSQAVHAHSDTRRRSTRYRWTQVPYDRINETRTDLSPGPVKLQQPIIDVVTDLRICGRAETRTNPFPSRRRHRHQHARPLIDRLPSRREIEKSPVAPSARDFHCPVVSQDRLTLEMNDIACLGAQFDPHQVDRFPQPAIAFGIPPLLELL